MTNAVDKVRAKYEKELRAAETEDRLMAALPSGARIHTYALYGTIASVAYGDEHARRVVAWDEARAIVRAIPPVSTSLIKNGCTSFQPREHVKDCRSEEYVSSVRVEVCAGGASLQWFGRTSAGDLVRVNVYVGHVRRVWSYRAKRYEYRGGFGYKSPIVDVNADAHTIVVGDAPTADLQPPIRWAPGSEQYPARVTFYWIDIVDDANARDVGIAIVDRLAELETQS